MEPIISAPLEEDEKDKYEKFLSGPSGDNIIGNDSDDSSQWSSKSNQEMQMTRKRNE